MTILDHTIAAGVESDLRAYRRWRARIADIELELADVSTAGTRPRPDSGLRVMRGAPSDPTLAVAASRDYLREERDRLLRRAQRVELCLEALTADQRRLVELRYFDRRSRDETCKQMCISLRPYYRIRAEILYVYAEVAGLIRTA